MPNKSYQHGYNLERYCVLTMLFNGFHVKRNYKSLGIEDIVGIRRDGCLLVQVKNTKTGDKAMTKNQKQILLKHGEDIDALPIFLYKNKNRHVWLNLKTGFEFVMLPYTKQWYAKRQLIKKRLRTLKRKSMSEYEKYVLENWDFVKDYIC